MHVVNIQKVLERPDLPAIVRLTAYQVLQSKTYMKPGDWLKSLHPLDLATLTQLVADVTDDLNDPATEVLIALTMILAQSEGVEFNDIDTLHAQVNQLGMFLTIEKLGRLGLAEIDHGNISFGEDMGGATIARGA